MKLLLNSGIKSRNGDTPCVLLLLDGINEVGSDADDLISEINSLSLMKGVQIILSSRSPVDSVSFPAIEMQLLERGDVEKALLPHGLVVPENPSMYSLLRIPLMLSIFIKTSVIEEKQIKCSTFDDLMERYFNALCQNEASESQGSRQHIWLNDAAVRLVLPAICNKISRNRRAVSEKELLPVVKKCIMVP